jgi:hypothetical protein
MAVVRLRSAGKLREPDGEELPTRLFASGAGISTAWPSLRRIAKITESRAGGVAGPVAAPSTPRPEFTRTSGAPSYRVRSSRSSVVAKSSGRATTTARYLGRAVLTDLSR